MRTSYFPDPVLDRADRVMHAERWAEIMRICGGDERLVMAFAAHSRAVWAGEGCMRTPEPEASFVETIEHSDGSTRTCICLADYGGVFSIYHVRANGRLARMRRWPAWLMKRERSDVAHEHYRRLKKNAQRRQQRRDARLNAVICTLRRNEMIRLEA